MTTSKENLWDSQDKFVYESPDRGETIYVRMPGSSKRVLIKESSLAQEIKKAGDETRLWQDICRSAKTNPVLQDMLDQIREYYYLTKPD
jgi:hypothetical protein